MKQGTLVLRPVGGAGNKWSSCYYGAGRGWGHNKNGFYRAAERYRAEQKQLYHIREFSFNPAFSPAERAALAFAVAALAVPNAANHALSDELRTHRDEGEIVEIPSVVSLFGFPNRWNDSVGTTLED